MENQPNEEIMQALAAQLRQPSGEAALEVGEKMNAVNLLINLDTIEALELSPNDNVLEIGMGNGFFVKNIVSVDQSITYSGCDFSKEMVDESCKQNAEFIQSGQVQFHLSNAESLPYGDEMFDKVFTINTIYFWEDAQKVLSEIRRVLKENGQFALSIRPKSSMDQFPFAKYGFESFSSEDASELLASNGFKIVDVIEKDEEDVIFFGARLKNEFAIVKGVKN